MHRETAFIFPPKRMEKAISRRARSDGVRVVFVVPTAHTAGYWLGLRARSVARLELTSPENEFYNPQEQQRRGRLQRLGDVELEERRRTRAELARLVQEATSRPQQGPSQPIVDPVNER